MVIISKWSVRMISLSVDILTKVIFTLFRREQKVDDVDVPASRFNIIERKMKPVKIIEYNQHMGGVDKMDQSRS